MIQIISRSTLLNTLKSGREVTPGQSCSVGVQRTLKIRNSWSISESPWWQKWFCSCYNLKINYCVRLNIQKLRITWKSGFFVTISANMVPRDQMSSGQEYLGEPSSTSGALENTVETEHQNNHASFGFENITPVPKCHNFMCVDTHRNPKSSEEIMLNYDHLSRAKGSHLIQFSQNFTVTLPNQSLLS